MFWIGQFVSLFVLYAISCSNISFLLGEKKSKHFWLIFIGMLLFFVCGYLSSFYRFIGFFLVLTFLFSWIYKDVRRVINAVIFHYFIVSIIDVTLTCGLFLIAGKDALLLYSSSFYFLLLNSFIAFLSSFLVRRKLFCRFWRMIPYKSGECLIIFGVILFLVLLQLGNVDYHTFMIPIIDLLFVALIIRFIYKMVEEYRLEKEMDQLLNFMTFYEGEVTKLRQENHEYQVALLYIQQALSDGKNIIPFIEEVLGSELKLDYDLSMELQKFQLSPLSGLLYYKLSICREREIHGLLNVSSNLSKSYMNRIDTKTLEDLAVVLNSLLDHAMEACLETSPKSLSIYIYEENRILIFQISHTFRGTLNINSLYPRKQISLKNKSKYSLPLKVQQKIKGNNLIDLKNEIQDDIFIQYLSVSYDVMDKNKKTRKSGAVCGE